MALAVAGATWLGAAAIYESSALTLLAMTLITAAGILVAARSRRFPAQITNGMILGVALAFLGMLAFFFDVFVPLDGFGPGLFAVFLFLAGHGMTAVALFMGRSSGSPWPVRIAGAGFALAAVPGLVWLYVDAAPGAYWWEPGNLASAAAGAFLALGTRSDPDSFSP